MALDFQRDALGALAALGAVVGMREEGREVPVDGRALDRHFVGARSEHLRSARAGRDAQGQHEEQGNSLHLQHRSSLVIWDQ